MTHPLRRRCAVTPPHNGATGATPQNSLKTLVPQRLRRANGIGVTGGATPRYATDLS